MSEYRQGIRSTEPDVMAGLASHPEKNVFMRNLWALAVLL
jgi:hypothetical protein